MNGLDEAPMRAMEERVRDAFGAAAETVKAEAQTPPAPGPELDRATPKRKPLPDQFVVERHPTPQQGVPPRAIGAGVGRQ